MDLASCTMINAQIKKREPKVSVKDLLQIAPEETASDMEVSNTPTPVRKRQPTRLRYLCLWLS